MPGYVDVNAPAAPVMTPLPPDAQEVFSQYESDRAEILKAARKKTRELRRALISALQELQDGYTRDARLDEAVAIRDHNRMLKEDERKAPPDPGSPSAFSAFTGRRFLFRVTGSDSGSVYGDLIYTADSRLAAAAVHAGVLKPGQSGIVMVTMLPGQNAYESTVRNGITSYAWGSYRSSYKVERADDDELDLADDEVAVPPIPPIPPTMPPLRIPDLPPDARRLVDRFQAEWSAIDKAARLKIWNARPAIVAELKRMQDRYTREARLDEAVAIRDCIRQLKQPMVTVLPNPGTMSGFVGVAPGVFYVRVTGQTSGSVYGTDVYTCDSALATAAVHAGVLKEGQAAIVKVTMLPGQKGYDGTTRHGVTSSSYGTYSASYSVEPAPEEDIGMSREGTPESPEAYDQQPSNR